MASVLIQIEHGSDIPVKTQIFSAYADAIRAGKLKPESHLPSIRALAGRLGVSPATVVAAYRDLAEAGLARASPRSGFSVVPSGAVASGKRASFPLNRLEPDLRIHPVAEIGALMAEISRNDPSAGGYEDYRGNPSLLETLADLDRGIGIPSEPGEGMLVTAGAQQALSIIARTLGAGARVAAEDPCYPGARLAFSLAGAEIVPVPMAEGLTEESLREISVPGRVDAFYCCPTYGNPSGRSWGLDERVRALEAAARGGFLIIEDDYLGDLDYLGENLPRLAALAGDFPGVRVVRVRTFSKTLLPALRIAGVAGPAACIGKMLSRKICDDIGCSAYAQRALARYIADGAYDGHLARVRPRYRAVRESVRIETSKRPHDGLSYDDPPGGLCLLARLPDGIDPVRFLPECAAAGVPVSPGLDYWMRKPERGEYVRLCFGSLSPEEVPSAISALDRACRASGEITQSYPLL
jgi:DNA-binding transcriptional MocR family regulator